MGSRTEMTVVELKAALSDRAQRAKFTPMELCDMYHDLLSITGWDHNEAGRRTGYPGGRILMYMGLDEETPTTRGLLKRPASVGYSHVNGRRQALTVTHIFNIKAFVHSAHAREVLALKAFNEHLTTDQTWQMACVFVDMDDDEKHDLILHPFKNYRGPLPRIRDRHNNPEPAPAPAPAPTPMLVFSQSDAVLSDLAKRVQAANSSMEILATLAKWLTEEVEKLQAALKE